MHRRHRDAGCNLWYKRIIVTYWGPVVTGSVQNTTKRPAPQWHLWVIVLCAFAVGMVVWGAAYWASFGDEAPHKLLIAFGTAGLTLAFGGVAGGLVAQIFKGWDARRTAQAAEQAFYRAILDDIKTVYDRVERAKLLIEAHQSAKTYGEQMRILPEADITLHNIRRALRPAYTELLDDIADPLYACSTFIKGLTGEFRNHYKDISDAQSRDEAINDHQRKQLAEGKITLEKVVFAREGWDKIAELEALKVLRVDARFEEYYVGFRWHIDLISFHLRKRLYGGSAGDLRSQLAAMKCKLRKSLKKIRAAKAEQTP